MINGEILAILREHGYNTQSAVAEALCGEIDHYKGRDLKSMRAFLSQILQKKRPTPKKLLEGLLQLCEGDARLRSLLEKEPRSRKIYRGVNYHLNELMGEYAQDLQSYYGNCNDKEKLRILTHFQSFVERAKNGQLESEIDMS